MVEVDRAQAFHVECSSLPDIYYISEVPSDLHWDDVGWIALVALVFCLIATIVSGLARGAHRTCGGAAL